MISQVNDNVISEKSKTLCVYDNCSNEGKFQCSRCKKSFYCCQDHQKYHWKIHKIHCKNMITLTPSNGNNDICINSNCNSNRSNGNDNIIVDEKKINNNYNQKNDNNSNVSKDCNIDNVKDAIDDDKRICRCMFCGEEMLLDSEDEAIKHMNICIALQEQLSSSQQFTIPTTIQNKMKSSSGATVIDSSVSSTSP